MMSKIKVQNRRVNRNESIVDEDVYPFSPGERPAFLVLSSAPHVAHVFSHFTHTQPLNQANHELFFKELSNSSDSSDSGGGVSLNPANANDVAVLRNVSASSKTAVHLASVESSRVTKARIGVIRAPTDDNIKGTKNKAKETRNMPGSVLGASPLQNNLTPRYEKEIDEPDSELIVSHFPYLQREY